MNRTMQFLWDNNRDLPHRKGLTIPHRNGLPDAGASLETVSFETLSLGSLTDLRNQLKHLPPIVSMSSPVDDSLWNDMVAEPLCTFFEQASRSDICVTGVSSDTIFE